MRLATVRAVRAASQVSTLPDYFLIYVILSVRQLRDSLVNDELERVLPGVVKLFKTLVPGLAILGEACDKVL